MNTFSMWDSFIIFPHILKVSIDVNCFKRKKPYNLCHNSTFHGGKLRVIFITLIALFNITVQQIVKC